MSGFLLGYLAGATTIVALVTLGFIAYRSAERSTPMAAGHWPMDDAEDDIDRELRTITNEAA